MAPRSQEIDAAPALEVTRLSKTFTRTLALSEVDLSIAPGEVHALLGQNGSGKSTLIKVLSGYHAPDPGGRVLVAGQELAFEAPTQSYRLGCRFVQQDLGLIAGLSVLDNLSLGSGFPTRLGTIQRRGSLEQARADLARLQLDVDPRAAVETLSASERTGVAVARALREDPAHPPRLLVLDEPTATLPADEVDALLRMVTRMAATGAGVLYVTHHLGEVFRVAQRVSVFRDGVVVGRGPVADFDHGSLVELLAGADLRREELETRRAKTGRSSEKRAALEVTDLWAGPIRGVSLTVHPGQIIGLAGLSGSGHDHILGSMFGARARERGKVHINGKALPAGQPAVAIAQGVAYLPPDRKLGGGVMTLSARENVTLPSLGQFFRRLVISRQREREYARSWFERLTVRPASGINDLLGIFSGGNQQKILFAKWLAQNPAVFLLDEPTQGVDVGAKADLHRELARSAEEGAAVLISSSDLEELADLCDRVLIFIEGRVSAELSGPELTEAAITRQFMPMAAVPAAA